MAAFKINRIHGFRHLSRATFTDTVNDLLHAGATCPPLRLLQHDLYLFRDGGVDALVESPYSNTPPAVK